MATLNEIARIAGVHKTTVSKALRFSADINPETAARIRKIAVDQGFLLADAPRESRQVAVLCPELVSGYYARIATALSERLHEHGLEPVVCISGFAFEREAELLKRMAHRGIAGVVCATEQPDLSPQVKETVERRGIPVVVIGMNYQAADHDVISVDEQLGIRYAVDHLTSLGHVRVAFIGDEYGMQRMKYLQEALAARSLKLLPEYNVQTQLRRGACGYEGMKQLLALPVPPTAVLAEYDDIALGAYRAIVEAGLRVPQDISLVGFDDTEFCRYLPVSLTSIDSHVDDMCRIATAILMKKIENPDYKIIQTVAIRPEFIPRESTSISKHTKNS